MFKKLLKNTLLTLSISIASITTANADLITQNIIFDDATTTEVLFETIGSITVDTNESDGFGLISSWIDFKLFGFDMITETEANGDFTLFGAFDALIDLTNLSAGIEFLNFDVTENSGSLFNNQGLFDSNPSFISSLNVFDFTSGINKFGYIDLGAASIVSEPPMFLLFFTGLVFMFVKRRKINV